MFSVLSHFQEASHIFCTMLLRFCPHLISQPNTLQRLLTEEPLGLCGANWTFILDYDISRLWSSPLHLDFFNQIKLSDTINNNIFIAVYCCKAIRTYPQRLRLFFNWLWENRVGQLRLSLGLLEKGRIISVEGAAAAQLLFIALLYSVLLRSCFP